MFHDHEGGGHAQRPGEFTVAAEHAALDLVGLVGPCLLYTSDAADERSSVDLGGRRIIKKKTHLEQRPDAQLITKNTSPDMCRGHMRQ